MDSFEEKEEFQVLEATKPRKGISVAQFFEACRAGNIHAVSQYAAVIDLSIKNEVIKNFIIKKNFFFDDFGKLFLF